MRNFRRVIHSEPDALGRVEYTDTWDDSTPSYCSFCGGGVSVEEGMVTCTGYPSGSTPERRAGCGASAPTMPRGQVFFSQLAQRHLDAGDEELAEQCRRIAAEHEQQAEQTK